MWGGVYVPEGICISMMQAPYACEQEAEQKFCFGVDVRQGCVTSPLLFSTYGDGCSTLMVMVVWEKKAIRRDLSARLKIYKSLAVDLFAYDSTRMYC